MLVHQILKSKPDAEVITLAPNSVVSEAAALLAKHRIGTVVISSDGQKPEGILSERDIVRELAKRGAACMTENLSDVMTAKIQTCAKDDNVDKVLGKMTDGRFRHMPVLEDGKLIGLISIGDVVKAKLSELAMEKDALEGMIMGH